MRHNGTDQNDLVVVRNHEQKFRSEGKVLADGTIRLNYNGTWMPVTNSDACKSAGLDPKTVAKNAAPAQCLAHMGDNGNGLHVYTAAEWSAVQNRKRADAIAALEAQVPGATEAIRLSGAAYNESERYSEEFAAMMDDENNDGARPPRPEDLSYRDKLQAHLAAHPRAALYLKAKHQAEGSRWADNTGAGAAGRRAMELIEAGATLEDASAALAVRREFVD